MVTGRVPKQNIKTTNPNKQIQRTQPGGHDDMFVKRAPNGTPTLPAGPPTNLQASTEEDRCGQMQRDIARKPSPSSCSRSPQPVKYVNLNRERFSAVFARRPAATERPPPPALKARPPASLGTSPAQPPPCRPAAASDQRTSTPIFTHTLQRQRRSRAATQ